MAPAVNPDSRGEHVSAESRDGVPALTVDPPSEAPRVEGTSGAAPTAVAEPPPTTRPALLGPDRPAEGGYLLLALLLCLAGFIGVAGLLYLYKFHDTGETIAGISTRLLFVLSIALVLSPFLLTIFRRVPVLFLLLPVTLLFLLYPLLSPFGLPYSRDVVFNFQFAQAVASAHTWSPGVGVTNQAVVYSYFPGGAVFNVEASTMSGLPLLSTFTFSQELVRLLVIPAAIFAISSRLFGSSSSPLAVAIYATVASTEMNIPTQQDFGVLWVVLALLCLVLLLDRDGADALPLRIALVGFSSFVVLTHHVSGYLMAILLGGLLILPWILRRRDPYPSLRISWVFLRYVVVLLVFVTFVSLPVVQEQVGIALTNISGIIHPVPQLRGAGGLGLTYPLYQEVWVASGVLLTIVLALAVLRRTFRAGRLAFVTFGILASVVTAILAIPFFGTGFSFLSLRLMEYAGILLAPAAAWYIVHPIAIGPPRVALSPTAPRRRVGGGVVAAAIALGVAFFLVAGGSLVPLSSRDQFAATQNITIDSPRYIDQNALDAALWAGAHLNASREIWGDYLSYTVFGGFGHLQTRWNPYPLFNGTGFTSAGLQGLHRGDYIVTDVYMTGPYLSPLFPGPPTSQPVGPLLAVEIEKFNNPSYFSPIYEDSIFTVYVVTALPPPT